MPMYLEALICELAGWGRQMLEDDLTDGFISCFCTRSKNGLTAGDWRKLGYNKLDSAAR